jgi:hypothetical protein
MRPVAGLRHFFGPRTDGLRDDTNWAQPIFLDEFANLARRLPAGIEVINCTPGSTLHAFPRANLEEVL